MCLRFSGKYEKYSKEIPDMSWFLKYIHFKWLMMLAVCLGNVALQVNLISFAPILHEIAKDLNIGMGTATNLMVAFTLAGSFALIVGGFLCDRFGILFVLILGNLCGSLPTVLMPSIGTTYSAVFLARLIEGFAMGFCLCTISPVMAIWFSHEERGIAGGIIGTSMAVGPAVGVVSSPVIFLATKSWQLTSAYLSVFSWVSLLFAVILALCPKPKIADLAPSGEMSSGNLFKRAVAWPVTWIIVMVLFFATWCLQTIYNITPTYIAINGPMGLGFGHMVSGKLMLSTSIAGILAPIIAGIVQDKFFSGNAKPFMFIGYVLICICMLLVLVPSVYAFKPFLAISLAFSGAGIGIVLPAVTVFIAMVYPVQIVGKILGLSMGIGGFGAPAGLFACGLVVERFGNYSAAITLISCAAAAGFIFTLFLVKPKRGYIRE